MLRTAAIAVSIATATGFTPVLWPCSSSHLPSAPSLRAPSTGISCLQANEIVPKRNVAPTGPLISEKEPKSSRKELGRRSFLVAAGAGFVTQQLLPAPAQGAEVREVGDIPASGLIFKDTIKINAFPDPKVKGVQLYITDFERPVTDRLKKDFFSDPTQASIGCAQVGAVTVSPDIKKGKEGEEVFEQARSLLFKTLRVRRIYDEETNTLVYVSYATRLNKDDDDNKSRFKTTTCAVHLNN